MVKVRIKRKKFKTKERLDDIILNILVKKEKVLIEKHLMTKKQNI